MKSLGTPAMNTTELIAKIAEAHGVSKAQAKSIVEDIFKDIVDSAASGAEVSLSGFGKFKVKVTPEREGRNPARAVSERTESVGFRGCVTPSPMSQNGRLQT
jgi:DNA-binding protein HU-beta